MTKVKYLLAILLAACLSFVFGTTAAAADEFELYPVSELDYVVYSSEEDFAFEVGYRNNEGDVTFNWVQVDAFGMPLTHESLGNGQAFLIYGIPEEKMMETFYYDCIASDAAGHAAHLTFSCVLYPMGVEGDDPLADDMNEEDDTVYSLVITREPDTKEFELGTAPDLTGIQLRAYTGLGYMDIDGVSYEGIEVYPKIFTATGSQVVSICYGGCFVNLTVEVKEAAAAPTPEPTQEPTVEPSVEPSVEPATAEPSIEPQKEPTATPKSSIEPSDAPEHAEPLVSKLTSILIVGVIVAVVLIVFMVTVLIFTGKKK